MTQSLSLKRLLALDATTCAAMGALLLALASPIATLTRLPDGLLWWAGLVLLPVAAFMALAARSAPVPGWMSAVVIFGNAFWVLASLALPVLGLVSPNLIGSLFLLGQAAVVAGFAYAQYRAVVADAASTKRVGIAQ